MLLNKSEFLLMNNPLRAAIQERHEIPIFLKMAAPRTYASALEIGCGNGHGAKLIKKHFGPEKITGIDLDERMIALARKHHQTDSVTFQMMNATNMAFPDKSFDVIFDFGIIHHIPNWRDCIDELKRVLKDDGEMFIEELAIESFSGFPGGIWRKILAHPYDDMFTFAAFEDYLAERDLVIVDKKVTNPLGLLKYVSWRIKPGDAGGV